MRERERGGGQEDRESKVLEGKCGREERPHIPSSASSALTPQTWDDSGQGAASLGPSLSPSLL
jgi:hypothetical protein